MTSLSCVHGSVWYSVARGEETAPNLLTDDVSVRLTTSAYTPDPTANEAAAAITELSATGYSAGGQVYASPTVGITSGQWTFDAEDKTWTGLTATVEGRTIVDDTIDRVLQCQVLGSFEVTAGTLDLQESADGIIIVDYQAS